MWAGSAFGVSVGPETIGASNVTPEESATDGVELADGTDIGCGPSVGAAAIAGLPMVVGCDDIIGAGDCDMTGPIVAGAETIIGDDVAIGFIIIAERDCRAADPSASICIRDCTCGCWKFVASDR